MPTFVADSIRQCGDDKKQFYLAEYSKLLQKIEQSTIDEDLLTPWKEAENRQEQLSVQNLQAGKAMKSEMELIK